ncbi:MAG: GGDEF domain-containing protein [Gammaproteobacteria bacterium]|nr:GGDEF domain-containing protein [Gammaproteobacteria bacterium]
MDAFRLLTKLWSVTQFRKGELTDYAESFIREEVRKGIMVLGVVSVLLLGAATTLYAMLGFGTAYVYTFSMLTLLSLHVAVSSRVIKDTQILYLLGMALLIIAGTAFVLLAHKTGVFSAALLSSAVLLFMVVPLVPWGLREASIVVTLVYVVFTISTLSVKGRFDIQTVWILQFLMLGSGLTTLTVVARNVGIRKDDIITRYNLENAHRELELLSYTDPLTGTWNRRFLETNYEMIVEDYIRRSMHYHFAIIDVNNFKEINDTYGHDYGDLALRKVVGAVKQGIRDSTHMIRLGGDEFALLFPGLEPKQMLENAVEVLAGTKSNHLGNVVDINISIGMASVVDGRMIALTHLFKKADEVLYRAKRQSKAETESNSVIVHEIYNDAERHYV